MTRVSAPQLLAPLLLAALLLAVVLHRAGARADTVQTTAGAVRGVAGPIATFRGIPFAAPPVGDLRWRPPVPVAPWPGVRDATRFGAACTQPGQPRSAEDCLFLNVWTPAARARAGLPVMVFVHGGGLVIGSGAERVYDGAALARRGVVVVTTNYRLGVPGFLAHPALTAESPHHSSGNYALLDQIAALRWVAANIARFGGDPHRVTVFGQSAGAATLTMLLAAPLAHGLFARMIAESPPIGWRMTTLAEAEAKGAALGDLAALRREPAAALVAHNAEIAPLNPAMSTSPGPAPLVDGWVIPHDPMDAAADGSLPNPVPLLVTDNADEGGLFADSWRLPDAAAYAARMNAVFGARGAEARALYPAHDPDGFHRAGADMQGDAAFYEGGRMIVRALAKLGEPTYRALFAHHDGGGDGRDPVWHGRELRYVFGTLDSAGAPPTASDRAVSDEVMSAWVRFAATGDPNGPGLPHWPRAAGPGDPLMEFGDTPRVRTGLRTRQLDFIASVFAR